jgi:hypothetical protein
VLVRVKASRRCWMRDCLINHPKLACMVVLWSRRRMASGGGAKNAEETYRSLEGYFLRTSFISTRRTISMGQPRGLIMISPLPLRPRTPDGAHSKVRLAALARYGQRCAGYEGESLSPRYQVNFVKSATVKFSSPSRRALAHHQSATTIWILCFNCEAKVS